MSLSAIVQTESWMNMITFLFTLYIYTYINVCIKNSLYNQLARALYSTIQRINFFQIVSFYKANKLCLETSRQFDIEVIIIQCHKILDKYRRR